MEKKKDVDSRGQSKGEGPEGGLISDSLSLDSYLGVCIVNVISLKTPRDACVLASYSKIMESAANSDIVWEKFLPQDYKSLVPRWREFLSKKELYIALCDDPVLIDNGKKRLWLEKASGKRCIMLPAMDLYITWGDNLEYWRWVLIPEARFGKIAELIKVCWFEIRGRINTRFLSPATYYSAYIVFKKGYNCSGFTDTPAEAVIEEVGKEHSRRFVYFDEATDEWNIVKPEERQDGWMEVELGEFYTEEVLQSHEIEISVLEGKSLKWKTDLIILGIEIRPSKLHYGNAESKADSEVMKEIEVDVKRALKAIRSENIDTGTYRIKQSCKGSGEKLIGIIGCLLLLCFCLQRFTTTPLHSEGGGGNDRIGMDVPKVLEYIPPESTEIAIDKDSEILMGLPEVLKYIPPERTEIAIDKDSEIVMDLPEVVEYVPPEITIDKDSDSLTDDGAKPEKFCSSDAKTHADLLDSKDKTFGIKQHFKELGKKLDLTKIEQGIILGYLMLLFFCLRCITYAFTTLLGKDGGAINRNVVDVSKVLECIPAEQTDNTIDKSITCGAKPVRSSSDAKTTADLLDSKITPSETQVFVSFRGIQLRNNFVGYLVHALQRGKVNVYIDSHEQRGRDLNTLFKRIEGSGIAIVVFSTRYPESRWCLEELVRIKERVDLGLLKVLPIFYNVSSTDVKRLKGEFGDNFRDKEHRYGSDSPLIKGWKEAIVFVSHMFALSFDEKSGSLENDFVETIVKEVLKILQSIS